MASIARDKPWIIRSDFNAVKNHNEKTRGNNERDAYYDDDFSTYCIDSGIEDLRFLRNLLT